MQIALKNAQIAYESGEIPVGALIVSDNKVISKAHNQVQLLQDPTAHAEMLAITSACNFMGSKYLKDCTLYVTLEPCLMCAGAIKWAQIPTLVYGAKDTKAGYCSAHKLQLSHCHITYGVLQDSCSTLLKSFFAELR
ncbi:MAG: nucleoside deaminase [Cytophagales bacterium]|nr:nucleoside deaminase [Cytophagales bacterium]